MRIFVHVFFMGLIEKIYEVLVALVHSGDKWIDIQVQNPLFNKERRVSFIVPGICCILKMQSTHIPSQLHTKNEKSTARTLLFKKKNSNRTGFFIRSLSLHVYYVYIFEDIRLFLGTET